MSLTAFRQTALSEASKSPTFLTDTFVGCYAFADALEALETLSYASAVSCA